MWDMLNHKDGLHEYLLLNPSSGMFEWTRGVNGARANTVAKITNSVKALTSVLVTFTLLANIWLDCSTSIEVLVHTLTPQQGREHS
mmetsp:Transcript_3165/g.4550  ORF Transcript_3165/g.4550 Transcript_3165/m.4550 type:complete len:86 (+) Transcript_3165:1038-1295(+)